MAPRRFTVEEKGKHVTTEEEICQKRIRAPEIDTSTLISENFLTMIGRVVNAREQPIGALLSALPRKWTLQGRVSGSDLGLNCFQFRFELEEDFLKVLAERPYHYNHWVVILQRWEPVISPLFPLQIPFWIRLQGLPLHLWHDQMIYTIAHDLGTLDDFKISKTSARIRVLLDGLKPLTKKAVIDLASGEELPITLEYEDLQYNCSRCNMLTHLSRSCPLNNVPMRLSTASDTAPKDSALKPPVDSHPRGTEYNTAPSQDPSFSQRVDRHGRPFGERVPLQATRGRPLANKIIPNIQTTTPRGDLYRLDSPRERVRSPVQSSKDLQRIHHHQSSFSRTIPPQQQ